MTIEISPLAKEDIPAAVEIVQKAFEADPYFLWVFDAQKYFVFSTNLSFNGLGSAGDTSLPATGSIHFAFFIEQFSKERNAASITARCLWGINNGLFYVAKDVPSTNGDRAGSVGQSKKDAARIVGVAMWLPPHPPSEPESWYSYFQSWILTFRQIANNIRFRGHGGLNVKRYWIWKDAQTAVQNEIWDDPRGYYFCNVIAVADDARGKGIGRKLVEIVTDKADQEGMKCYLESSKDVPNLEIYGRMGFKFAKEMECHDGEEVCKLYCMTREPQNAK